MNGKKFDSKKNRLELVPTSLVTAVGWVLTYGAQKYGERNWEKGLEWSRPYGAILRHLFAWWSGELNDKESGRNHLWHAATELAFLIDYAETHKELDNRPGSNHLPASTHNENNSNEQHKKHADFFDNAHNLCKENTGLLVRPRFSGEDDSERRDFSSPQNVDSGTQNAKVWDAPSAQMSFDWGLCDG